ncbi:G-protein coupled receptor Mth2 [Orchesella cincta]|uniref:G-protein coupled receptor Mth2 n=1 Tax=Orchesella cincta TaxID=48709 RepID=A0A1D2MMG9_ORCCI|nr:G-protein coupled receptor Mth2 [Orchesella cincta]
MFFLYVFCAIAHILSTIPNSSGGGRSKEFKVTFCWIVAIVSHYFFMTTFTWLTVMNFDLWLTFRSMRPVSRMSKRVRRFWLYFAIGYGFPVILLISFISVDITYYSDEVNEVVKLPEYGKKNCFVAIWSRAYYMYSLVAIALAFNTILVAWTCHIFYVFRRQNINTFTTKRAKSDKYSVRLFIKLFCVMGVGWFVELLSWKYNGDVKPWSVVGLDCLFFFLQSFAIFFIFCVNRRTLAQLTEKYPKLTRVLAPLRQRQWFKASDVDGVEMTTPGSTPRKLSLSVTANSRIDSTLPRKASTSSIRSAGVNYSDVNGKMETINLDSDADSGMDSQKDTVMHKPDLITNT